MHILAHYFCNNFSIICSMKVNKSLKKSKTTDNGPRQYLIMPKNTKHSVGILLCYNYTAGISVNNLENKISF